MPRSPSKAHLQPTHSKL